MSGITPEPTEQASYAALNSALLQAFAAIQTIDPVMRRDAAQYAKHCDLALRHLAEAKKAAGEHFKATAATNLRNLGNKGSAELHDKFASKSRQMWSSALGQLHMAQAANKIVTGLLAKESQDNVKPDNIKKALQQEQKFWGELFAVAELELKRWYNLEHANTGDLKERALVAIAFNKAMDGSYMAEPEARTQRLKAYVKSAMLKRDAMSGQVKDTAELLKQQMRCYTDAILQSIDAARKLSREFPEHSTIAFQQKHAALMRTANSKLETAAIEAAAVFSLSQEAYKERVRSTTDAAKLEIIHDQHASVCRKHWSSALDFIRQAEFIREKLLQHVKNLQIIAINDPARPDVRDFIAQRNSELKYWHELILMMAAEIKRWLHAELEATLDPQERQNVQSTWQFAMFGGSAVEEPLTRTVRMNMAASPKAQAKQEPMDDFSIEIANIVADVRSNLRRDATVESKLREPRKMPKFTDLVCPDSQVRSLIMELFNLRKEAIELMLQEAPRATNPQATVQAIQLEIDALSADWEKFIKANGNQQKIDDVTKAYLQQRMPRASTLRRPRSFLPGKDRFANIVHREEYAMDRLKTVLRFNP